MAKPSGQLMSMPILIINMGGEMVYILEQRLQAQKISEAKGQKVLSDVVGTMYYGRFIEELFKPQEMYSFCVRHFRMRCNGTLDRVRTGCPRDMCPYMCQYETH